MKSRERPVYDGACLKRERPQLGERDWVEVSHVSCLDEGKQPIDKLLRRDPLGLRFVINDQAVIQRGTRQLAYIVGRNREPSVENGACFASQNQILRGTRSCPPRYVFADKVGSRR